MDPAHTLRLILAAPFPPSPCRARGASQQKQGQPPSPRSAAVHSQPWGMGGGGGIYLKASGRVLPD